MFSAAREILDRQLGKPTVSFDPGGGQLIVQLKDGSEPLMKEINYAPPLKWNQEIARAKSIDIPVVGENDSTHFTSNFEPEAPR